MFDPTKKLMLVLCSLSLLLIGCGGYGGEEEASGVAVLLVANTEVSVGDAVELDGTGSSGSLSWTVGGAPLEACFDLEVCVVSMTEPGAFDVVLEAAADSIETASATITVTDPDSQKEVFLAAPAAAVQAAPVIPFSPDDISSLKLWLDGDDGETVFTDSSCTNTASIGQDVACWKDKSGNGLDVLEVSSSRNPAYQTDAASGKNVVYFGKTTAQDIMTGGDLELNGTDSMTMFFAMNGDNANLNDTARHIFSSGSLELRLTDFSVSFENWGVSSDLNAQNFYQERAIMTVQVSASNYHVWINDFKVLTGSTTGNISMGDTFFLATFGAGKTFGWYGKMFEMLVYTTSLADSERENVEKYLADKWKVYHPQAEWVNGYSNAMTAAIHEMRLEKNIADTMSSSMKVWLDANTGSSLYSSSDCQSGQGISSGTIGCWKDRSGNNNHVISATGHDQPSVGVTTLNSQNVISFDGSVGDGQELSKSTFAGGAITGASSTLVVFKTTDGASLQKIVDGSTASRYIEIDVDSTNDIRMSAGTSAQAGNSILNTTDTFTASAVYNGGSSLLKVSNNTQSLTPSNPGSNNLDGLTLGRAAGNADPLTGYIAEVIVLDSALSSSDHHYIQQYLLRKWGISYP